MLIKSTLSAGAFVLMNAIAANAADLTPIMVSAPPPPPSIPAPTFDWAGPYIGAYGGYTFGFGFGQAGLQAGYNFVMGGGLLAGIEAQAGVAFGGGLGLEGDLNGRLGYILGGNFLLFGEAGLGIISGTPIYTAGGGMEVAVGQSVSVFAEAKAMGTIGGGIGGLTVQGGLNWHPTY